MVRREWFRPSWWRWWWQTRASIEARVLVIGLAIAVVAWGGYLSEGLLTSASAADVYTVVTTVRAVERIDETVTGRPDGRLAVHRSIEYVTLPGRRRLVTTVQPLTVTTSLVRDVTVAAAASALRPDPRVTVTAPARTLVRTRVVTVPVGVTDTRAVTSIVTRTVPARPTPGRVETVTSVRTLARATTDLVTTTQPVTATVSSPNTTTVESTVTTVRTATVPVTSVRTVTVPVTTVRTTVVSVTTTLPLTTTVTSTATQPVTATVTTVRTQTAPITLPVTLTVTVSVPGLSGSTAAPTGSTGADRTST